MSDRGSSPAVSNRTRSSSRSRSSVSRSRSGSPASKGSGSNAGSRGSSPGNRSRSSGRSRSASSGSIMSEDEAPTERKDIEDSGSEPEDSRPPEAMEVDRQKTPEAEAEAAPEPEQEPERDPEREPDPEPERRMSVDNDDSEPEKERKQSESGSDAEKKRKPSESGSDKMSGVGEGVGVGAEDIFGDNLSISSDDDSDAGEATKKKAAKALESDEDSDREVQRYDDDNEEEKEKEPSRSKSPDAELEKEPREEEEVQVPETRIDVEVPKITTDLGKDLYFVKLPNFLSVECRPFDPENYEDEIEDEDSMDEEGRQRLKLKVENTIRWRQGFTEDGKAVKESNARIVRWSDGSTSLYLGNEVFDVHKQSLHGDFNHMFIRQGTGLQGQAIFRTKLSFRPHSTESKTHQKMTRQMADRSHKATGIKVISQVGRDPEANRYKRVKEEEERLRADLRKNSKINRVREKASSRGLSKGYLEGADSDEEGFSISAIKNRYKKGGAGRQRYSSDEDDSDVETSKAKRLEKAKANISDSDEDSNRSRKSSRASSRQSSKSGSPASRKSGSPSSKASGSPARSASSSRSPSRSKSRSKSRSRSRSGSSSGS